MDLPRLFLSFLIVFNLMYVFTAARPLPMLEPSLATRLASDNMAECWSSLFELRSCTSEIILFFLNGETYLGPPCCRAIEIIEHQCWPSMLGSLGFTAQEGNILRGFCDATASRPPPPPSPSTMGPALGPVVQVGR